LDIKIWERIKKLLRPPNMKKREIRERERDEQCAKTIQCQVEQKGE